MMKFKLFIIAIFVLACQAINGYTTDLADCEEETLQAAIDAASSGATIDLPAGSCTWTDSVSWNNKVINLIGKGTGVGGTLITVDYAGPAILSTITSGASNASRISAIKFTHTTTTDYSIKMKGQGWRVDHIYIDNNSTGSLYAVYADGANSGGVQPFGLIDSSQFDDCRFYVVGAGAFSSESAIWAEDSSIGTANAVYIEDNTVNRLGTSNGVWIDASLGGRWVFRYNSTDGAHQMHSHSIQGEERAPRSWEIYGNYYNAPLAQSMFIRGGTGMIHGNYLNGAGEYYIAFDNVRTFTDYGGTVGICDGTSAWDGNTAGEDGWPCRDQIGRGKDASLSTVENMKAQESEPVYLWANWRSTSAVAPVSIVNGSDAWIQNNRDYYDYAASFDGTVGTGCGTLAARPATCTTGVGYWATTQSCSDLTGMVGAFAATPISGTLYKCTATNTWTAYYIPYAYPHPLRNETSDQTLTLTVEGSGACTVTSFPAGISSTSSTTQDFEQNTEVTMTVSVTSPNYFSGWSGTGGCTGTGSCIMTMSEAKAATATCSRYGVGTIGAGGQITFGTGGSITLQ